MKYFICKHCGNIVEKMVDKGVPIICCGEPMTELVPNTTEAATEKHLPVFSVTGNTVTVKVGAVTHPMLDAHWIEWIVLETANTIQRKNLAPGVEPQATFALAEGDHIIAAYEYCNIHGLWKSEF